MNELPLPADLNDRHEQDRYARGLEVLRAVAGDAGTALAAALSDVSPDLAHHLVAWGFGDMYARPALSPRDRQLVTLGALTALGTEPQIEAQVHAALNVGLTAAQVVETLLHTAPYVGFPRALNATLAAKRVFDRRQLLPIS